MLKTSARDASDLADDAVAGSMGRFRRGLAAGAALGLFALFLRIMTYPLQHDEQFYITAGALFDRYPLYSGIGFSHLPNVAILFSGAFALAGDSQYLLVGRLIVFAAWLGIFAALFLIARDYVRNPLIGALMIALLALNPLFLNATGMAATNNLLPVPFMLLGLYLFLRATDRDEPSPRLALASGVVLAVGVGFKANYALLLIPFAIAALIAPRSLTLEGRFRRIALPLLLGGLIGGLPTLYYMLSDPTGFIAHVVSFHQGPQLSYWAAYPDPHDPKVIGMAGKLLLAHQLWLSGVTMLVLVTLLSLAVIIGLRHQSTRLHWSLALVAGIAALGVVISFVPTPAFAQYFTPPLPFAVVLVGLLFASLDRMGQRLAQPVIVAVFVLTIVTGAPLLLSSLPRALDPSRWTPNEVTRDAAGIAAMVRENGWEGPVATLSPIHVLEGHLPIYPEFALGPFVYRAAQWVPADDRRHYDHFLTPDTLPALLAQQPPAAVLTGVEGNAEASLDAWAAGHHFRVVPLSLGKVEDGEHVRLYHPR